MTIKNVFGNKISLLLFVLLIFSASTIFWFINKEEKTIIKTSQQGAEQGFVVEGATLSTESKTILQTDSNLVFESKEIEPELKNANAAILKWDQTGGDEGVIVEARTKNDGVWTEWAEAADPSERKDNTPAPHAALVLGKNIQSIQYRFILDGSTDEPSPTIDTTKTAIEAVDTTQGPEPVRPKSFIEKVLGSMKFEKETHAVADSPPIYSRAAWGAPEPNSSARWEPEYRPLSRVIVHHTATPFNSDVGAQLRAIWHYHANSLGWGDIGYNYLVDHGGNIFQGRYYDQSESERQKGEVVAGHAYGNNYGTTGISLLGDFTHVKPSGLAKQAVANIAAFKAHKYDFNPAEGTNLVGHRDVLQTACPGNHFYPDMGQLRSLVWGYYPKYSSMSKLDTLYKGQGISGVAGSVATVSPGQTVDAYVDLMNNGKDVWSNTGSYPIRIATNQPRDSVGVLRDTTWLAPNRIARFTQKVSVIDGAQTVEPANSITPGEIARFNFKLRAPLQGGTHKQYIQAVAENRAWFLRDYGIHFTLNVPSPTYGLQHISQASYTNGTKQTPLSLNNLSKGQRFYSSLKIKNTSNHIWRNDGVNPIYLATSQPVNRGSSFYDGTWVSSNRVATMKDGAVAPGQTATFEFWMRVPSGQKSGPYKEYFNLVAESKQWFPDYGIHWAFQVGG